MKNRLLAILAFSFCMAALPAFADLASARASGAVGEKLDGYITALKPSAEINALVDEVNARRRTEYAKISAQKGQPVDVVAKVAAGEVINNLPPGSAYQGSDGSWKTR
jgi:uncharacterized protein YdbL (DUF1318 family)